MKPRIKPIVLFFLKKGFYNNSGIRWANYYFHRLGGLKFKNPEGTDKKTDTNTEITYKYILQLPNNDILTKLDVAGVYDSMEEAKAAAISYIANDIICNYMKVEITTQFPELVEWRGKSLHPQFVAARITRQKCTKEKRAEDTFNIKNKRSWGTYKYDVFLPHPKVMTKLEYHSTHDNEEKAKEAVREHFKNSDIFSYMKPYLAYCSNSKIEWQCEALSKTIGKFAIARIERREE